MIANSAPVIAVFDEDGDDQLILKNAFAQCRQDLVIRTFEKAENLLDYLDKGGLADLLILGLHLPWESMFDTIATIKSNPALRHIPLIVLIGPMPDSVITRFYDLGANTVIARPAIWDDLVSILRKTCDYWFGPIKM